MAQGGCQWSLQHSPSAVRCSWGRSGSWTAEQEAKFGRCKEKQHLPQHCCFCGARPCCSLGGCGWGAFWEPLPLWEVSRPCSWISACQPAWAHLLGLWGREAVQEATSTFILAPFSYPFLDKLSQTWCQNCEVLVSFCKAAWMTHVISQITDKTGGGLKKKKVQ